MTNKRRSGQLYIDDSFDSFQANWDYVPNQIADFLVQLTSPQNGDEVLFVGINKSDLASAQIVNFDSRPVPPNNLINEISFQLNAKTLDVIICAPAFGTL